MGDVAAIFGFFRTFFHNSAYLNMTNTAVKYVDESELLRRHEKLIRFVATPYASNGVSEDDLMQEGRIALLSAAKTWRESEAQLWTYAIKFVRAAVSRYASNEIKEFSHANLRDGCGRRAGAEDSISEGHIESYEENIADPDQLSPEEELSKKEILEIVAVETEQLSAARRLVLKMSFDEDCDIRTIAKGISAPKSTAHDFVQGTLTMLRDRVEGRL